MNDSINQIWSLIITHEGHIFTQKKGGKFSYVINGNTIQPIRHFSGEKRFINRKIPKGDFSKALELCPISKPSDINFLQGPSFIYGILTDKRISCGK